MRLVLISGLSGSGKSVAIKVLEDAGFYCIDNLPAPLLPETMDHLRLYGVKDTAVSIDARSGANLVDLRGELDALREHMDVRILFLTSREETLVKRFSETRRRHPLASGERSLEECIREEREMLSNLSANAHLLDTSDLSANALRAQIKDLLSLASAAFTLVFDVRCLPNPHYDPALRPLTGRDTPVIAFLRAEPQVGEMLEDIRAYVAKWLPAYIRDNRNYFTVGLGCTGGQHRSVYFAETLAAHFRESQQVLVRHRELG